MNRKNLINIKAPNKIEITVCDNLRLGVKSVGDLKKIVAQNVHHMPNIFANLMSVSQKAKNGNTIVFDSDSLHIYDKN